jgi:hypothetical protein
MGTYGVAVPVGMRLVGAPEGTGSLAEILSICAADGAATVVVNVGHSAGRSESVVARGDG